MEYNVNTVIELDERALSPFAGTFQRDCESSLLSAVSEETGEPQSIVVF